MSPAEGGRPVAQAARDRLRAQARREQDLAGRVIAAQARLAVEMTRTEQLLAARDRVVSARREEVADALIAYLDEAGVRVERAASILGQDVAGVARLVSRRRAVVRRRLREGPA